eukprot:gb/GECG01011560.1/.p1 GENE.gb/GECG01011560.1/~~gb/GECG01011560.1/.p1  ORF type:complete len:1345 (+),score=152.56 gb/GECG01011560.1/:1-4035(+)
MVRFKNPFKGSKKDEQSSASAAGSGTTTNSSTSSTTTGGEFTATNTTSMNAHSGSNTVSARPPVSPPLTEGHGRCGGGTAAGDTQVTYTTRVEDTQELLSYIATTAETTAIQASNLLSRLQESKSEHKESNEDDNKEGTEMNIFDSLSACVIRLESLLRIAKQQARDTSQIQEIVERLIPVMQNILKIPGSTVIEQTVREGASPQDHSTPAEDFVEHVPLLAGSVAAFVAFSFGIYSAEDMDVETTYLPQGILCGTRLLEIVLDRNQPFYTDQNEWAGVEQHDNEETWQRNLNFGDNLDVEHHGSYHAAQVILNDGNEILAQIPGIEVEVRVPIGSSRIRNTQALSTATDSAAEYERGEIVDGRSEKLGWQKCTVLSAQSSGSANRRKVGYRVYSPLGEQIDVRGAFVGFGPEYDEWVTLPSDCLKRSYPKTTYIDALSDKRVYIRSTSEHASHYHCDELLQGLNDKVLPEIVGASFPYDLSIVQELVGNEHVNEEQNVSLSGLTVQLLFNDDCGICPLSQVSRTNLLSALSTILDRHCVEDQLLPWEKSPFDRKISRVQCKFLEEHGLSLFWTVLRRITSVSLGKLVWDHPLVLDIIGDLLHYVRTEVATPFAVYVVYQVMRCTRKVSAMQSSRGYMNSLAIRCSLSLLGHCCKVSHLLYVGNMISLLRHWDSLRSTKFSEKLRAFQSIDSVVRVTMDTECSGGADTRSSDWTRASILILLDEFDHATTIFGNSHNMEALNHMESLMKLITVSNNVKLFASMVCQVFLTLSEGEGNSQIAKKFSTMLTEQASLFSDIQVQCITTMFKAIAAHRLNKSMICTLSDIGSRCPRPDSEIVIRELMDALWCIQAGDINFNDVRMRPLSTKLHQECEQIGDEIFETCMETFHRATEHSVLLDRSDKHLQLSNELQQAARDRLIELLATAEYGKFLRVYAVSSLRNITESTFADASTIILTELLHAHVILRKDNDAADAPIQLLEEKNSMVDTLIDDLCEVAKHQCLRDQPEVPPLNYRLQLLTYLLLSKTSICLSAKRLELLLDTFYSKSVSSCYADIFTCWAERLLYCQRCLLVSKACSTETTGPELAKCLADIWENDGKSFSLSHASKDLNIFDSSCAEILSLLATGKYFSCGLSAVTAPNRFQMWVECFILANLGKGLILPTGLCWKVCDAEVATLSSGDRLKLCRQFEALGVLHGSHCWFDYRFFIANSSPKAMLGRDVPWRLCIEDTSMDIFSRVRDLLTVTYCSNASSETVADAIEEFKQLANLSRHDTNVAKKLCSLYVAFLEESDLSPQAPSSTTIASLVPLSTYVEVIVDSKLANLVDRMKVSNGEKKNYFSMDNKTPA